MPSAVVIVNACKPEIKIVTDDTACNCICVPAISLTWKKRQPLPAVSRRKSTNALLMSGIRFAQRAANVGQ
eukprot:6183946-Pleurochrysis_carterae.AAC.2